MRKDKRSGRGRDDEGFPDDDAIFAMTVRHGADYTKQYLNAIARPEASEDDDSEQLARFAADLGKEPQAEVLPFAPREPKA